MSAVSSSNSRAERPSIGGWVPFSTVDWPGKLAAVVFIAGCPWRCHYCHNPHLQQRTAGDAWPRFLEFLESRRGLLDGVVFSGGEPLSERHLPGMLAEVRCMGFQTGLHTAGIYPRQLKVALGMLDWVGLDIKTNAAGYRALTGRSSSLAAVATSLNILLESGCDFECRTTWSPAWLDERALVDLAQELAALGVKNYAVQGHRPAPDAPAQVLDETVRRNLDGLFANFTLR